MKPIVWSYGGGTQSAGMAVLIATGKLPKPDLILMADTGREASATWEYTNTVIRPLLSDCKLNIEIIPHSYSTVDLYGLNGDLLIPAFTRKGKLRTFCSNEWKQFVVRRRLRELGLGPDNPVVLWLGITVDEVHRLKPSGVDWLEYQWPLAWDFHFRRGDCVEVVTSHNLPRPPRSSCWMCPYRNDSEWEMLKDRYPGDWIKAVALDEAVRLKDTMDGVWIHRSLEPLSQVKFSSHKLTLFDGCESGFCMT